ncbi:adhesin [Acinetobacter sp. c2-A9]
MKLIPALFIAMSATSAMADSLTDTDVQESFSSTVDTKTVNYSCQGGKRIAVTYGFNEQGLPTYAEADINGASRTMPINLGMSGGAMSSFGEEDSFTLSASAITSKNVRRSSMMITDQANEIVYKACKAR